MLESIYRSFEVCRHFGLRGLLLSSLCVPNRCHQLRIQPSMGRRTGTGCQALSFLRSSVEERISSLVTSVKLVLSVPKYQRSPSRLRGYKPDSFFRIAGVSFGPPSKSTNLVIPVTLLLILKMLRLSEEMRVSNALPDSI